MFFLSVFVIAFVCFLLISANLSTDVENQQRYEQNNSETASDRVSDFMDEQMNNATETNSTGETLYTNSATESNTFNYSTEQDEFKELSDGAEGFQFDNGTEGLQFDIATEGFQFDNVLEEFQFDNTTEGFQFDNATEGFQFDNATEGLQFDNGTEGLQFDNGTEGPQFDNGTEGFQFDNGTEGLQFDNATEGLQFDNGTEGLQFDNGTERLQFDNGTEGFQFDNATEGLQFDNATDNGNYNESYELINSINLKNTNDSSLQYNTTNLNNITGNFQPMNFTQLSDIINDFQFYNSSDIESFIDRFEMPNFTEPSNSTESSLSNNETEFSSFTQSYQFTSVNITTKSSQLENPKQSNQDLKTIENTPTEDYNKHILVKREESDASFQREIDEFDEELVQNQTLQKLKELEAKTESMPLSNIVNESTSPLPESEQITEEPTTEEGPTVYPYTSKDGLIDVVADNGIKYISSESDNFPRSGEESGNIAGITDDSEPMHYVISGESNLSEDSRKEVGIEDLLPDYVKPTVSGESEKDDIGEIETVTSSEQITLSEEEEEPITTTTEPYEWPTNSWEFKGENYEGTEETKTENITISRNQTKLEEEEDMEYKDEDEEENQITRTITNNITSNAHITNVTNTQPTINGRYNTSTVTTVPTTSSTEPAVLRSSEKENNSPIYDNNTSVIPDESSEYDPWGNDEPTSDDNKSVIGNTIDLDEIKKNGDQVEMIEMSFDSSSANSTNFSLESDQMANQNFSFQNIELGSSESDDRTKSVSKNSEEDYDIEKTENVNANNEKNLPYNQNITLENTITDLNKTDLLNKELNQTWSNLSSNQSNENNTLPNIQNLNDNITEAKKNKTKTMLAVKNKAHKHKKYIKKHSKNSKKSVKKMLAKDQQNINKTIEPTTNTPNQEISTQGNLNLRRKRGIFYRQDEQTTESDWPQNSREYHGELYESPEVKKISESAKSEDFSYFHASDHSSEYSEYSNDDVSVHMIERNTSKGVKIFITKKNSSKADIEKDYKEFMEEFKHKDSEVLNRRRRDVEERLLEKYNRFQTQNGGYEQNFEDTPVTKLELREMLSKLFLHKLKLFSPVTQYKSSNVHKFIFKKDDTEENVNSKPQEIQDAYKEFIKTKMARNEINTPTIKIKTNFKDGIYKWNKKLNRLEKINK